MTETLGNHMQAIQ